MRPSNRQLAFLINGAQYNIEDKFTYYVIETRELRVRFDRMSYVEGTEIEGGLRFELGEELVAEIIVEDLYVAPITKNK